MMVSPEIIFNEESFKFETLCLPVLVLKSKKKSLKQKISVWDSFKCDTKVLYLVQTVHL